MPDIDTIRKQLADTALYHGLSYAAIVGVAATIEAVTDKAERAALRREFKAYHSLTAVVWARVAKRFDGFEKESAQGIRGMAYCCQLPSGECMDMWYAHFEHITEPGALGLILRDVNDALDARRNGNGAKRATKDETAEQVASYCEQCAGNLISDDGDEAKQRATLATFYVLVRGIPAVATVLARRGKVEK